ncbi:MAG: TIGR01777 family oxidoreductase [Verrucomicrobiales bacterium]|nr:TIGR01777 family oxidoreductase [Verrucomicrobiales bacterium]
MRIGVTGASGFIGGALVAEILANNNEAIGFSRSPGRSIEGCSEIRNISGDAPLDLSGLDAIVHFSGESLLGVWTPKKREEILNSRIRSTQRIVNALWAMDAEERPKVFACASAVGIYGDRGDEWLDEEADAGFGFLADVTRQWESVAIKAADMDVRTVLLRIGFVVGESGGAIPTLENVFKMGLGGKLGSGKQWMPWIHIDDVATMIHTCLENRLISGPVNVCAPDPVRNKDFTKTLADVLGKKAFLPVPSVAFKMLPGRMHEMFLNSLRVDPTVMKSHSFQWQYPVLEDAIRESVGRG